MAKLLLNERIIVEPLYKGAIISNGNSINFVDEISAAFIELCQLGFDFNEEMLIKYTFLISTLIEIEVLSWQ